MLVNNEEMVVIPPTNNEWRQEGGEIDDHSVSMASCGGRVMEKPNQELLQQQQQALKCPRCDSTNTKFCYYNNYSLSQPRHFCKACKRYWTRGGTLRNVPVGGGCRKNKRLKRPIATTSSAAIETSNNSPSNSSSSSIPNSAINSNPLISQPHIDDIASTSNYINNPLFYGLPSNSCDVNLRIPFPSYDLDHPHLNALGLGFSSGENGLISSNNTLLSTYNSMFGSNSISTPPTTPLMASLLSSTLLQQKLINGGGKIMGPGSYNFQGFFPIQDLKREGNRSSEAGMVPVASKEVKVEGQSCNNIGAISQNYQMEHVALSDPNSLYWNASTAMGAANWNDQPNIGPNSLTSSLI